MKFVFNVLAMAALLLPRGGRSADLPRTAAHDYDPPAPGSYVLLSVTSLEDAVAIARSNPMHGYGLTTKLGL